MRRPETPFGGQDSAEQRGLYLAMELSHRQWQLGLTDRRHKMLRVTVEARNLAALQEQIRLAKAHFDLPVEAPVFSCYEAGRDGFWLHRYLVSCGIINQVLESASIKVDRRWRRAKTDRLDVERMLQQLLRYLDGDSEELHVVRVPTPDQEDARRLHREQLRLKEEPIPGTVYVTHGLGECRLAALLPTASSEAPALALGRPDSLTEVPARVCSASEAAAGRAGQRRPDHALCCHSRP